MIKTGPFQKEGCQLPVGTWGFPGTIAHLQAMEISSSGEDALRVDSVGLYPAEVPVLSYFQISRTIPTWSLQPYLLHSLPVVVVVVDLVILSSKERCSLPYLFPHKHRLGNSQYGTPFDSKSRPTIMILVLICFSLWDHAEHFHY